MRPRSEKCWLRFPRDERGNVAMMFGLAIVPLLGLTMAAIEYGFMAREQAKLQAASDAASVALAPLAAALTQAELKAKADSIFRTFVGDNFTLDPPTVSEGRTELTLVARTNYKAEYIRFPGMPSTYAIKVASKSIVTSKAVRDRPGARQFGLDGGVGRRRLQDGEGQGSGDQAGRDDVHQPDVQGPDLDLAGALHLVRQRRQDLPQRRMDGSPGPLLRPLAEHRFRDRGLEAGVEVEAVR
jgi:Flp pilus assembly protein TadG